MPEVGETKPCPLCREEHKNGTLTWTKQRSTATAVGEDGAMREPGWIKEWQCDLDHQHNRTPNEP